MIPREQCQEEPYERMIPIRPQKREDYPVHDEIADEGEEH
jgi:hypothetical protein